MWIIYYWISLFVLTKYDKEMMFETFRQKKLLSNVKLVTDFNKISFRCWSKEFGYVCNLINDNIIYSAFTWWNQSYTVDLQSIDLIKLLLRDHD